MPKGIVLTQQSVPADAAVPTIAPLASPLCAGAGAVVNYRSVEDRADYAQLQYCDAMNLAVARDLAAPSVAGVARYCCVEVQDSGASSEIAPILMIVAFCVPAARAEEVERWYVQEHAPLLLRAPGWLRMRRYQALSCSGRAWTSLALHELRSLAVLDTPERAFARSTPWRAQLEREAWFGQAGRFVYERISSV